MYEMLAFNLFVFRVLMFPYDRKIITKNEPIYYEKRTLPTQYGVLPFISSSLEWITTYTELILGQFNPSKLIGTFQGDPHVIEDISPTVGALVCMMSSSNIPQA